MKPWEYSPKLEAVAKPSKPEVPQKTDDVVVAEGHPWEAAQPSVYLPPILLKNLMAWVAKFHELRIQHPNGITINATPEHVRDAAKLHPWGVVYDSKRYLLMSWGDAPTWALMDKRDLETDEVLTPEAVTA